MHIISMLVILLEIAYLGKNYISLKNPNFILNLHKKACLLQSKQLNLLWKAPTNIKTVRFVLFQIVAVLMSSSLII